MKFLTAIITFFLSSSFRFKARDGIHLKLAHSSEKDRIFSAVLLCDGSYNKMNPYNTKSRANLKTVSMKILFPK